MLIETEIQLRVQLSFAEEDKRSLKINLVNIALPGSLVYLHLTVYTIESTLVIPIKSFEFNTPMPLLTTVDVVNLNGHMW
ncbi:MAG: hypothetical protein AAF519_05070 [Bacteroidota bacterium]